MALENATYSHAQSSQTSATTSGKPQLPPPRGIRLSHNHIGYYAWCLSGSRDCVCLTALRVTWIHHDLHARVEKRSHLPILSYLIRRRYVVATSYQIHLCLATRLKPGTDPTKKKIVVYTTATETEVSLDPASSRLPLPFRHLLRGMLLIAPTECCILR